LNSLIILISALYLTFFVFVVLNAPKAMYLRALLLIAILVSFIELY